MEYSSIPKKASNLFEVLVPISTSSVHHVNSLRLVVHLIDAVGHDQFHVAVGDGIDTEDV